MKKTKKLLALLLTAVLLFMTMAVPVSAASKVDPSQGVLQKAESILYKILDKMVTALVKTINMLTPGLNWTGGWPTLKNYTTSEYFLPGEDKFDTEVSPEAKWSAGFAKASLLDGIDVFDGSYYMAGTLEAFSGRIPTELVDDQGVCAYALSDGVSGIVVQAVVDGYGLTRGDVIEIRKLLADLTAEKNIVSINISVLHQHSCIDILGMGAPLVPAIFANPANALFGKNIDSFIGGKNPSFMKNLYKVTAETITNAVESMTDGELYYGYIDIEDYIHDKRDPQIYDKNLNRFRFVPYDANVNEIWICEASIHCVGLGAGTDKLSGDYPYYMKEYIKEVTGADVVFVQGAELALTGDYSTVEYDNNGETNAKIKAMGYTLGKKLTEIDNDVRLDPVLNITHSEVIIKAENEILILAVREGLLNSVAAKDGLGYAIITEIGYMELGNKVGIVFAPGEIAPEIIWGGAIEAEKSWSGESWDYAPIAQTAGTETVLCFGLMNDQIGYIITDNDIRSIFTENEEINASSYHSASTITNGFEKLIDSVK